MFYLWRQDRAGEPLGGGLTGEDGEAGVRQQHSRTLKVYSLRQQHS